ncbi:hypothetical protein VMCG_06365 [Cytospora schulzeri]|uniref:Rhodopsin domain-containing protein n=1 Tax=Cytospora schulzeri TaxID=448051 RepID=A0A423W800_9PEZI|nr:hypothetical protein VMCG_06365 [Valsa malicola]
MALGGKGPIVVVVLFVEAFVSALFIGLRWFTRRFIRGDVGADDYVLWATLLFQVLFAVFFLISSIYGFGQHNADLDEYSIMMATKVELMGQFSVSLAMGASKAAVALLLLRIINIFWQRCVLWFWIFSMMFLSILLAVACFAQCTPVESLWNPKVPVLACPINLTNVAFVMCSWSAAMDFFLAFFPWYVLWKLNMKRKDKITICVSLSLGVFAGACGIVRTTGLAVLGETADYLYATADSVMWTSSELCITIVCVSIPSLRPLWQRFKGGSSTDPYYNDSHSRGGFGTKLHTNPDHPNTGQETGSSAYPLENMNNVEINGGRDVAGLRTSWHEADDTSDKSILGKSDGIVRKQEVSVEYSTR